MIPIPLGVKARPDPIDLEVGRRIRAQRRALSISQGDLAEALGVTFQQVQKYERGTNRISASMRLKAAAKLETTVADLIGETRDAPRIQGAVGQPAVLGAEELLGAYAKIKDAATRRAILELLRALSGPGALAEIEPAGRGYLKG
jgi:transcriptional regulator with XRE-family HTH domain